MQMQGWLNEIDLGETFEKLNGPERKMKRKKKERKKRDQLVKLKRRPRSNRLSYQEIISDSLGETRTHNLVLKLK
jgi:hypothetical protein